MAGECLVRSGACLCVAVCLQAILWQTLGLDGTPAQHQHARDQQQERSASTQPASRLLLAASAFTQSALISTGLPIRGVTGPSSVNAVIPS